MWCDADLVDFDPRYITRLIGPLLAEPEVRFVKGAYDRVAADGSTGGRTTELMARPLLSLLFPELAHIQQPLGGEYAGRRALLECVPFVQGYGVEIGLLIDVAREAGVDAIAQVDLGERRHRSRPLEDLGPQAAEVLATALNRAGVGLAGPGSPTFLHPVDGPIELDVLERPPLADLDRADTIGAD